MIYFVGIYNKPHLSPLSPQSPTGQAIDKIIEGINSQCIKTNLCDLEYLPKDSQVISDEAYLWHQRNSADEGDTVILLGKWVQKHFIRRSWLKVVNLTHPAGIFGNKINYVQEAIRKINLAYL